MGKANDLDRARARRVAAEVAPTLAERGSVDQPVDKLGVTVDTWRAGARLAGRDLGHPVRTGITADGSTVWAASLTWRPTAAQETDAARRLAEVTRAVLPKRPT